MLQGSGEADHTDRLIRRKVSSSETMAPTKTRMRNKLTTLLSPDLNADFRRIFTDIGFEVIWSDDPNVLRKLASETKIDVALEWQHDMNDFPVRDMLWQIGKRVPLIMSRNWRQGIWADEAELWSCGYKAVVDVPFDLEELIKTCERITGR